MKKNVKTEIILVEDNMGDAELTIQALEMNKLNCLLTHLENGADALDYIFFEGIYHDRNSTGLPIVILLNLTLPKVGGTEVPQKIKGDERTKNIPVTILT